MVMLEAVAIVLLAVCDKEETDGRHYNKRILVVMVLLLLAGYTKQLAYATVIGDGFMFLRDWKRAIKWAIRLALRLVPFFCCSTLLPMVNGLSPQ